MNFTLMLFIFSAGTIALGAFSTAKIQITEELLQQCYKDYPFFMEALMLVTDKDFADPKKTKARKIHIESEFKKRPSEIRTCTENIIQFAKDQNDAENLKHVLSRMKEITSVVYVGPAHVPEPRGVR